MYIETIPNRGSRPAVLLREAWREGQRVRKRTVANLTDWPTDQVETLRRVLKGETLVPADKAFVIERSLPHGHVEAVLLAMRRLGLAELLSSRRCPEPATVAGFVHMGFALLVHLYHRVGDDLEPRRLGGSLQLLADLQRSALVGEDKGDDVVHCGVVCLLAHGNLSLKKSDDFAYSERTGIAAASHPRAVQAWGPELTRPQAPFV